MQQLPLGNIVLSVAPDLMNLLTSEERTLDIVLRNGVETLKTSDVKEILEAVIQRSMNHSLYQ
ncbi:hypothetical protein [Salisediminibacterium beveridgei]|uniref:Uncharacterized protein n=1 Tax=Salisediminibacterium beveridgei TaxID=632773 RepID=A0A1D7QSZ7_9BACI|nr:hypothetical protein [Salisediminibacterium beveridgei]AOM82136.1 hypothetical protein BBEV_0765 [Salisediminibacterium beveridgei]